MASSTKSQREAQARRLWLFVAVAAAVVALGLGLGLGLPKRDDAAEEPWSSLLGWSYFVCWSISFWPQIVLNWQRKSVGGMSFDYVWMNLLGFSCLFTFNASLYLSTEQQASYMARYGKKNLVQINDVFFAGHAVVATTLTVGQIYFLGYSREPGQRVSLPCRLFVATALLLCTGYMIAVAVLDYGRWESGASFWSRNAWTVLSFLYFTSYVKLCVSLLKYIPQLYSNWRRQSTVGWSIGNILLDFSGGLLSLVQLVMDGAVTDNWEGVLGDPVKFALGSCSLFYDPLFMIQHYCLYFNKGPRGLSNKKGTRQHDAEVEDDERMAERLEGLLGGDKKSDNDDDDDVHRAVNAAHSNKA